MSNASVSRHIIDLLNSNNFNIYNVPLAKNLGLTTAIFYQGLLKFDEYWGRKNKLNEDGYFYATAQTLYDWTGLTDEQQRTARAKLVEAGLVDYRVMGMPAKGHYKINTNLETLINTLSVQFGETQEQDCQKSQTSSLETPTISNNISTKISNEKSSPVTQKTLIQKPAQPSKPKDIPPAFISEVITYLNAKAGRSYSPTSANAKKFISARAKEGHTLEHFKHVIDVKVAQWLGDDKMEQYLRPETLFGTKFASYLTEKLPTGRVRGRGRDVESIDSNAVQQAQQKRSNEIDDEIF